MSYLIVAAVCLLAGIVLGNDNLRARTWKVLRSHLAKTSKKGKKNSK